MVRFGWWAGKGSASPVELAAELLKLLAAEFTGRQVHAVGDAAYHSRALREAGASITTRLPVNAALFDLAPPRTGKRGRPRLKASAWATPPRSPPAPPGAPLRSSATGAPSRCGWPR